MDYVPLERKTIALHCQAPVDIQLWDGKFVPYDLGKDVVDAEEHLLNGTARFNFFDLIVKAQDYGIYFLSHDGYVGVVNHEGVTKSGLVDHIERQL